MKVKVFESNPKGKVEFTRAELEKLLNEIYMDGYREGEAKANSKTWTWTTPYYTCVDSITSSISSNDTCDNTNSISSTNCIEDALGAKTTSTTTVDNAKANAVDAAAVYTAPADSIKVTANAKSTNYVEDFIAKLAKELNF